MIRVCFVFMSLWNFRLNSGSCAGNTNALHCATHHYLPLLLPAHPSAHLSDVLYFFYDPGLSVFLVQGTMQPRLVVSSPGRPSTPDSSSAPPPYYSAYRHGQPQPTASFLSVNSLTQHFNPVKHSWLFSVHPTSSTQSFLWCCSLKTIKTKQNKKLEHRPTGGRDGWMEGERAILVYKET